MNDEVNQTEEQGSQAQAGAGETVNDMPAADELALLKQRARLMGINFSNNIGLQALRQKIEAKQNETDESENQEAEITSAANPLSGEAPSAKPLTIRQIMQRDQMKLVRIRITCLDPKKKDLPGEIFTIANEYLGTVRKYVPFGEVTENGYHVPYCIYTMLKDRKFLNIRVLKTPNGQPRVESNYAQEFAIEVLPPLTKDELARLANAQAAAGTFTNPNA